MAYRSSKWQGQPEAFKAYNRRRTAEALARQDAAKQQAQAPEHQHYWSDWSMDATDPLEHRGCRCGATETREFRGL